MASSCVLVAAGVLAPAVGGQVGVCLWVASVPPAQTGSNLSVGEEFQDLRGLWQFAQTVLKIELGRGDWVCTSTHQEGI